MNADQFFGEINDKRPRTVAVEEVPNGESTYNQLSGVNVNKHTEKKGQFTYLSWAFAVQELLKASPGATWDIHIFDVDGDQCPYMRTGAGYFVQVTVVVDGVPRTQVHPVLNFKNQPVTSPNAFDINTAIQRCLTKAIALHGLGLYIYAGEDLPPE